MKPALLLILLLGSFSVADAQDANIHRCIGANGEPTFSDQKCAQSGLAVAPSKPATSANVLDPTLLPSISLPTVTQTCPTSAEDLRDRVVANFGSGSGVGLSGLFLWDGFGQGSSMAPLKELAIMLGEPLISIELDAYADVADVVHSPRSRVRSTGPISHELVIRTMAEQERRVPYEAVRRFEMTENLGCWWLRLP
ncbi:hypothetical protein [Dokdonella sp.]|uniref:hypothetical protein n=1 Tax=Dokdonella sp. TaxID=2291710 RepID=UPI003C5A7591